MTALDKTFGAASVIGTAGAIVAGFAGQRVASVVMLAVVVLSWQAWLTVEVVALRKARSVAQTEYPNLQRRRSHINAPLEISASSLNALKINADFLLWPECCVMLWVLVPPKGEGLRDSPSNRYLLAHHTGQVEGTEKFRNQFALRHSSTRRSWECETSNNMAEYGPSLAATDGLESGWHHFLISWSRAQPKRILLIDGGRAGSDVSSAAMVNWPERAGKLFIGTWVSEWHEHFCETKIASLRVVDRFLSADDTEVHDHLQLKMRT